VQKSKLIVGSFMSRIMHYKNYLKLKVSRRTTLLTARHSCKIM